MAKAIAKGSKARTQAEAPRNADSPPPKRARSVTKAAKDKAAALASSPLVAEVVAAALVATAAAIRDPKKARQIASATGDELRGAAGGEPGQGSALWNLAKEVARRSLEAVRHENAQAPVTGDKDGKKKKAGGKRDEKNDRNKNKKGKGKGKRKVAGSKK